MNTFEMMELIRRNKDNKYRLPYWKGTDEHVKYCPDKEILVHTDETPFRYMRYLNDNQWEEYNPKVMFSQLMMGDKFKRISPYEGVYMKLNPSYLEFKYEKCTYYNTTTFNLHSDDEDFEVERVNK